MLNKNLSAIGFVKRMWKEASYIIALIVLIIFASIASSSFLQLTNVMNILRQASIVGIISLGMTFVIISGGIDLSVGSVLAVTGAILLSLQISGIPTWICIIIACLASAFIGFINGFVISKARLAPFIVTLATMTIARSLVIFITDGANIIGNLADKGFANIGGGKIWVIPVPVLIFAVLVIIMAFILNKTKFGRYVYAVGGNEETALYSGIRVDRIKIATYSLLGLMVGIASTIEASRLASVTSTSSGLYYEMDSIAAVIIGGTPLSGGRGKIYGTVVGVIILAIIGNIMNLVNVSPYLTGTVKGIIIIVAVMIQRREKA